MASDPSAGLYSLPPELYLKLIEHLFIARDVAVLSTTCKRLNLLNNEEGWRVFIQARFPSLAPSPATDAAISPHYWRAWARSLTHQSAAWDRRAIRAEILHTEDPAMFPHDELLRWNAAAKMCEPFQHENLAPDATVPRHKARQTTATMPVLSSMLEEPNNLLSMPMLVCGAGPDVYMHKSEHNRRDSHTAKAKLVIQHKDFRPGMDDITSINMMKSDAHVGDSDVHSGTVDLISGRSSGYLHRFRVSMNQTSCVVNTFHISNTTLSSSRRSVRSADVNAPTPSLLAACSDKVLSLYSTTLADRHDVWPEVEIEIEPNQPSVRAWTAKFISTERLTVGLGGSSHPLALYHATPAGLSLQYNFSAFRSNDGSPISENGKTKIVYAIDTVSPISHAGGSLSGTTLLSGWYDGACRLYDIRASQNPVMTYYDPVDVSSAVFSLATFGKERFLVGSASSKLKIFDFRLGAKAYFYTDALPCSPKPPIPQPDIRTRHSEADLKIPSQPSCSFHSTTGTARNCTFHKNSKTDFYRPNVNVYLNAIDMRRMPRRIRTDEEPIYSISRPSATCPVVYASTKGTIYKWTVDLDYTLSSPVLLKMYETDDGIHNQGEPSEFIPKLRSQRIARQPRSGTDQTIAKANRLDISWQNESDHKSS